MTVKSAESLKIGDIIRITFEDDITGEWKSYVEHARVTYVGKPDGKYMPLYYTVIKTNHPTFASGRNVIDDETRPWSNFTVIDSACECNGCIDINCKCQFLYEEDENGATATICRCR